jgi:group I intron endonuclease
MQEDTLMDTGTNQTRYSNAKKSQKLGHNQGIGEPPKASGIYQIQCIPTGKIYVGSAINLALRWRLHVRQLTSGKHHNKHLQNAWDCYGSDNFEFAILERVEKHNLLAAEQVWIDKTGCANRDVGFNLYRFAGSPGDTFAQVWHGFVDPEGNEVTISNLSEFCRLNNLDQPSMIRLAQGKSKLKSYKGWTHRNSVRKRPYTKTYDGFIDPEGHSVGPITNLAAFCRERGLDKIHMVAVAHGRLISHHGWTYHGGRQPIERLHLGFVSPDGEHVVITNLAMFVEYKVCILCICIN